MALALALDTLFLAYGCRNSSSLKISPFFKPFALVRVYVPLSSRQRDLRSIFYRYGMEKNSMHVQFLCLFSINRNFREIFENIFFFFLISHPGLTQINYTLNIIYGNHLFHNEKYQLKIESRSLGGVEQASNISFEIVLSRWCHFSQLFGNQYTECFITDIIKRCCTQ